MKLTKDVIKQFELEQKEWGTEIALWNVLFLVGSGLLKDIGVKQIKTSLKEKR